MAAMLTLSLAMLMDHGSGVRMPIHQRDIRRVLRSVLTLVRGFLHSSEDAGHSGSESDQDSDSHGDDADDDRNDRRRGCQHSMVRFTQFRARGGAPPPWQGPRVGSLLQSPSREEPIDIKDDHHSMLVIHDGVVALDVDTPDDPSGSDSAPGSLASVCLHLRQCRRGTNMHVLRVTCRDCGETLRAAPQPD
jgi:hypothetical protein